MADWGPMDKRGPARQEDTGARAGWAGEGAPGARGADDTTHFAWRGDAHWSVPLWGDPLRDQHPPGFIRQVQVDLLSQTRITLDRYFPTLDM